MRYAAQKGQALVIILLVLAVASTVVISLASRTVTDITITTKEKESARAFSAAEAGIEAALVGGPTQETLAGGESYVAETSTAIGGTEFNFPEEISAGETVSVWFVSHDPVTGALSCSAGPCFSGSQIDVCWGKSGTPANSSAPAIEAMILYLNSAGNYGTARVARVTADPYSGHGSNFDSASSGCTVAGKNYAWKKNISFGSLGIPSGSNVLQVARVKMFYNINEPHPVGVVAPSSLPAQGTNVVSTGKAEESTRKIEVFRTFPDVPPVFDFGAWGGGITKP